MDTLVITPVGMSVGWWVQLPVADDAAPLWVRIGALLPPGMEGEHRWAIRVDRGAEHWWVKVAPHLMFPVCDVDPTFDS